MVENREVTPTAIGAPLLSSCLVRGWRLWTVVCCLDHPSLLLSFRTHITVRSFLNVRYDARSNRNYPWCAQVDKGKGKTKDFSRLQEFCEHAIAAALIADGCADD